MPLRYLITYLAAAMWPGEGLFGYFARMDVMTDRSGRVACDSHNNEPT